MKIVISGASGLIGSALVKQLRSSGHEVITLVRSGSPKPNQALWNPAKGEIDTSACQNTDVFINLSGAGVGDRRWTTAYKKEILNSRVQTTQLIAKTAAAVGAKVLINASAIGWYGETGSTWVDESSPVGNDFLAEVVQAWENATQAAVDAGVRVVTIRTGLVAAPSGGAWAKMLPLFKLGLGGQMGSGKQYWSFISLRDELRAIEFLMNNADISGPVNLTAPEPATNSQTTKALARALALPALFPVPAPILKVVLGEFSTEVLGSKRVMPKVLLANGFEFLDADIESAMNYVVGKTR